MVGRHEKREPPTIEPDIRVLADGLDFPEGPAFDAAGDLWCTELKAGNLVRWSAGGLERFHVGEAVNGCAFDRDGRLWFTDSQRHVLGRFDPATGRAETVLAEAGGERLNRPNDLAFDPAGNLVVSCHADSRTEPLGWLFARAPDGSARAISRGKYFTNGIAFSADGAFFIFAETYRHRLWKARWDPAAARIVSEEVWAHIGGPIGPDGMAFDADGNLFVAVFDMSRLVVVSPAGEIVETLTLPVKRPTNCAFDPSGRLGLVVTDADRGCLMSIAVNRKGGPVFRG